MKNYKEVPFIITGKDLDYLTDMFHWNYLCYKCMNNASLEVVDKEIKNIPETVLDFVEAWILGKL